MQNRREKENIESQKKVFLGTDMFYNRLMLRFLFLFIFLFLDRFLHYLNTIQVHPKSSELIRLQNEFEVKPISDKMI